MSSRPRRVRATGWLRASRGVASQSPPCTDAQWVVAAVFVWRQIKAGFAEGKELVVTVLKAMGEEAINAVKDGAK